MGRFFIHCLVSNLGLCLVNQLTFISASVGWQLSAYVFRFKKLFKSQGLHESFWAFTLNDLTTNCFQIKTCSRMSFLGKKNTIFQHFLWKSLSSGLSNYTLRLRFPNFNTSLSIWFGKIISLCLLLTFCWMYYKSQGFPTFAFHEKHHKKQNLWYCCLTCEWLQINPQLFEVCLETQTHLPLQSESLH